MHVKIGRNDPCPCGSGKKHKICCMGNREVTLPIFSEEVRDRAFGALYQFATRDEFVSLRDAMLTLFFGPELFDIPDTQKQQILQNEDCMGNFFYWFLFEASLEGRSRTLVDRFLSRKAHVLPLPDRRYLEAMRGSHLRLYEVESVQIDEGMRLRDCWDGAEFYVRERLATHQLAKHSVVALRLRQEPHGEMVIDGPGFAGFSHADKEAILSELRVEYQAVLETGGNTDDRFSFYQGAVIAQHVVYGMLLRPAPQLSTSTGEPLVFCKVTFDVADRALALEKLARIKELAPDNDDESYAWIRGKNRVLHASVRFEPGSLVAETHSTKRAAAVRKLLERHLGEAVRYRGTQEQDAQSALAEYRAQRTERVDGQEAPMPAEVAEAMAEYEDHHYRFWIDTPVPALANKTPRQAARFRGLRGTLVGLLKDFTAAAELQRRATQRAYDFSWMWGELGINPNDPMNMRISRINSKRDGKAAGRGSKTALVYRLKVTLLGTKPPVWRRILLSGKEPLDRVHMIVNRAMDWTDTHLHAFEVGRTRYSVPDPEAFHGDKDERKVRLADLPLTVGSSFYYWYDFGDGWEHRILVEAIEPADGTVVPTCLAGRRACPPEDIGGSYGYRDFLKSPERWPEYGPAGFQPDAFDLDEVNEHLGRLPKRWVPIWR